MNELLIEWMNRWIMKMNELSYVWLKELIDKCINDWITEGIKKWMIWWMRESVTNKRIKKWLKNTSQYFRNGSIYHEKNTGRNL